MRVRTSVALVLAWLLLHSQPGAADGIGGWPLLHWGMSKQQVERVYPNFEEFDYAYPMETRKEFGLHSYHAAGCEFSMILRFSDNKLNSIRLYSVTIEKGSFNDQICRAKDTLSETYGQPEEVITDIIPNMTMFKWVVGDTEISCWTDPPFQGLYHVYIEYIEKGWRTRKPGKRL
jgi:hypothetical protein